jgi:hypothetical protein
VSLDLVVLGRLVRMLRMGLDFGVLVLALLVRHFSSFECFAPSWRCYLTRRIPESKSSPATPFGSASALTRDEVPGERARSAADAAGAERSCVGADPLECVGERFDVGVGEVLGKVSLDSVSVVAAGAL